MSSPATATDPLREVHLATLAGNDSPIVSEYVRSFVRCVEEDGTLTEGHYTGHSISTGRLTNDSATIRATEMPPVALVHPAIQFLHCDGSYEWLF